MSKYQVSCCPCYAMVNNTPDILSSFHKEELLTALGLEQVTSLKPLIINYKTNEVKTGKNYSLASTQETPLIKLEHLLEDGQKYVLIMIDPDAPSKINPKFRSYLHWVITDLDLEKMKSKNEIIKYIGPAPPKGSGPHRYVFLLYEQPTSIQIKNFDQIIRSNFDVGKFTHDNNLHLVAGNYYIAENK
ncbi:protein D2-like isoform X2 [Lepeophtheirus salmonis]|uniref:protein D2-like isoform X2 n=1 Tax=Lepeophtheirus salmonis TaxID=72036 RepID=UPI001AE9D76D|nr:protein D1-like isoform X2 [Lepeophtheirus salmonis]